MTSEIAAATESGVPIWGQYVALLAALFSAATFVSAGFDFPEQVLKFLGIKAKPKNGNGKQKPPRGRQTARKPKIPR
jgi:hypothetical protein